MGPTAEKEQKVAQAHEHDKKATGERYDRLIAEVQNKIKRA